jgi:hypothetical protein
VIWGDVDAARDYLAHGGGKRPTRKVVYNMVADGMKVARIGDTGRRLMFCHEWIDEYLLRHAAGSADRNIRGVA